MSVTRRDFIKTSAGLVIGITITTRLGRFAWGQGPPKQGPPDPNAFLRIGTDDSVTVLLAHSEMGQGIWTTLPMLVAEELGCDWGKIRVEHAPSAPAYAHIAFGIQATGGSSSTWSELMRYRQVGAMARDMLVRAAAAELKVDPSKCTVANGVISAGGKKVTFGKVAAAAQKLTPPATVTLKEPKDWTIIGKPTKRLDSPEKVTGKAQYGMDIQLPGMLTAVIARAPVFGAKLKGFKPEKAMAVPGVKKVVQVPSGVAVVGEHFWAAKLGRDALEVDWDLGPGAALDSAKLRAEWRALSEKPGMKAAAAGDVAAGMKSAGKTVDALYELPYLAHATMEPLNATVQVGANGVDVYTGTQFQGLEQFATSKILGVPPEKVRVHTPFLGGGFGRRGNPAADFVSEAAAVAKELGGQACVKVVWTREDDTRGGYYRAMWTHRLRAGLGKDGMPVAWRQTLVGQSIAENYPMLAAGMIHDGVDGTSVEGAADSPYVAATPNYLVDLHSPKKPVPVHFWRSVGNTHTAFVMESFIDELAHAAGQDPVDYRRRLLGKSPRHRGVLDLAVEKAEWTKPLPAGRFRGVAIHESFGSYMAEVAEVSIENDRPRVHRVVCAVDCGVCVNPAGVNAQIESGIVYGLTAALNGQITFKDGKVEQSNFHDYPLLRLNEMPQVEVHILPSTEKPGGIGEVAVPPIAPAVANAIFAATGQRLRSLPFKLEGKR